MTADLPRVPVWIRAALFVVVVPGAIAGWLPWYWGGYPSPTLGGPLGIAGAALTIAGWGVLLSCARDFAVQGIHRLLRARPEVDSPPAARRLSRVSGPVCLRDRAGIV